MPPPPSAAAIRGLTLCLACADPVVMIAVPRQRARNHADRAEARSLRAVLRRRRSGAFTLLELLVVISIIAIASAVAVPRLSGSISNARVTSAGQRIIADLARARSRAIAQSASVTLRFSRLTYEVIGDQRTADRAMPALVTLTAAPYYTQVESADLGGTDTLTYDMFGTPSSGGAITLTSGGHAIIIKIDEASGIGTIR